MSEHIDLQVEPSDWKIERGILKALLVAYLDDEDIYSARVAVEDGRKLAEFAREVLRLLQTDYTEHLGGIQPDDLSALLRRQLEPIRRDREAHRDNAADQLVDASAGGQEAAYVERDGGLALVRQTPFGEVVLPLTNFAAKIVAESVEDDGSGVLRRSFAIEATLNGRVHRFSVAADQFRSLDWVLPEVGAGAIVYPGGLREHARVAIQVVSGEPPVEHISTHTGWVERDGHPFYLTASGAIGADGLVTDIRVALPDQLAGYRLPAPPTGEALVRAVRASIDLLDVAPRRITWPLHAATSRSVLGEVDCSLHLDGLTGIGKSELAARFQQHFGAGLDRTHLPGAWSSTGNALERLGYLAKDATYTVDDYKPLGTVADAARLARDADRLFRGAGVRGRPGGATSATADPQYALALALERSAAALEGLAASVQAADEHVVAMLDEIVPEHAGAVY